MPLSEEELRMLEQMERALVEEDPKLASTLRGTSFRRSARRKAIVGGVILVAGVAMMVSGLPLGQPILGIAGFLVMLGGAVLAVTAMRAPAAPFTHQVRDTRHTGLGVVDGGRRSRHHQRAGHSSFMERVEQRWRHRRERGF